MIKNLSSAKDQKITPICHVDPIDLINFMEKTTELNNFSILGDHID
jgi:hypothetical protein